MLSGSTRSVVFLIKILVWETVHHNVFVSKIGSQSRSRRIFRSRAEACGAIGMAPQEFKIPAAEF